MKVNNTFYLVLLLCIFFTYLLFNSAYNYYFIENMDNIEPREPKEPKEPREPKEPKEPIEPKEPKEPREPREPRESKEPREPERKNDNKAKIIAEHRVKQIPLN